MASGYLHQHKDFGALLSIIEEETGILAGLVEKDYWIMHVLYGLRKQLLSFELKGGTSLSKGYGIIHRFSEDIDIHIKAPPELNVDDDPSNNKADNIQARAAFYEWLSEHIAVDGIVSVARDREYDDPTGKFRSGGIRLKYETQAAMVEGVKEGILLEAGFDTVTPNSKHTISSWAYDRAIHSGIGITDNRALEINCYHPGYTFVEKLQTIATKFRQEQTDGREKPNYMRQYYDVYCLLDNPEVKQFIGTEAYHQHKKLRFPRKDFETPISENEAYLLTDEKLRKRFNERYIVTKKLYYKGQPPFTEVLDRIAQHVSKL